MDFLFSLILFHVETGLCLGSPAGPGNLCADQDYSHVTTSDFPFLAGNQTHSLTHGLTFDYVLKVWFLNFSILISKQDTT